MKNFRLITCGLFTLSASVVFAQQSNTEKARETLAKIDEHYAVNDGTHLYRETFPFDSNYQASYLAEAEQKQAPNAYSYLWPFSGSLSAYVALLETTGDNSLQKHLDEKIIPGLNRYFDKRSPVGYASYIHTAPESDRFYDDNIWLGIDFTDLYLHTKNKAYLEKAEEIWKFVASGMDDKLGGGIYWCEQKKSSKNTCSNAPAVVYLAKLHQATKNQEYLTEAIHLYEWTKRSLQDPSDHVYWDNISLKGSVNKSKYPYNTGQMIQAGALLFEITKEKKYLVDAESTAKGGFEYFFAQDTDDAKHPVLKSSDNWFIAVMMRGYVELYKQNQDKTYIDAFRKNLAHAWSAMRDEDGLFTKDWNQQTATPGKRWLLDQFAIAEMYARLAN